MGPFRLVIFDYAKEQLQNPIAQKILSDMIFAKQKNFLRTDPNYIVMDKHDMIGTHYLIYDTQDFLNPKLIFAIRTTFLERSQKHRIETPLMSLIPRLEKPLQTAFENFKLKHPHLVDCNAWFVDPAYSKKQSGLNLSDLGYFMVCMNLLRFGYENFVGCTNEKYHASRWLKEIGSCPEELYFEHPVVQCRHRLILLNQFNLEHFQSVHKTYKDLIENTFELFPPAYAPEKSFSYYTHNLLQEIIEPKRDLFAA